MPTISRGDVLLTQFPFTDLSGATVRACLVVSPGLIGQDLIVAGISSVVRGDAIGTDVLVEASHPEFSQTGLRVRSVIRLHKLAAIQQSVISRRLGMIGLQLQAEVDQRLKVALGL
jgi:mRNA interferase MazF